jgi:hypothetical protein
MFQPLMGLSSQRCVTKGGYIKILQKFVNQCTDVQY